MMIKILFLFVFGLIFYSVEVFILQFSENKDNFIGTLVGLFKSFIPGNIVWNVMFYTLIYFFLFSSPKGIRGNKKRTIIFRCFSIIPSFILIFSVIFKIFLEDKFASSYYISLIFYSKGVILTAFAFLYLYILFIYRIIIKRTYGDKNSEIYYCSNRYNLTKNIIAVGIILILFSLDLIARYNLSSSNKFKLGNNWAIITLVPFILFYRDHLGKRNFILDMSMLGGYGFSLACTYIIMAIVILSKIEIFSILKFLA